MNILQVIGSSSKSLTILTDFNNCIADNLTPIIKSAGGLLKWEDFYCWDPPLGHLVGLTEKQFIDWAWKNHDLQMAALPFPGVKNAIDRLRAAGHKVQIVTSTPLPPSKVIKWLDRWHIKFDGIIFSQNKLEVAGDVLIDDSPETIKKFIEAGRPIIAFEIPWNKNKFNCPSFGDWRKVEA